MNGFRASCWALILACGILAGAKLARTDEAPPAQNGAANAAAAPAITDAERNDARALFAAQCSWCHGDYGMKADRGPRLAGTQMTEHEVEERIRNGKAGYMPSFKRFLNDQQIALMAKYIKSLKPDN
jgi:mono/diheme cytochrome c family protein